MPSWPVEGWYLIIIMNLVCTFWYERNSNHLDDVAICIMSESLERYSWRVIPLRFGIFLPENQAGLSGWFLLK